MNTAELPNRSRHLQLILCAILIGLSTLVYGRYLQNPIVFDDIQYFLLDHDGGMPIMDFHFSLGELRSFPYSTLAWTKQYLGLDLIYFRVTNLCLHVAVVLALFFFIKAIAKQTAKGAKQTDYSIVAGFFSALILALHPISVYSVAYLVQRTMLMSTLFSLLALQCYLQGSLKSKPWILWMTVPMYYFAVFSKEHVITLPALMIALTILFEVNWKTILLRQWKLFLVMAIIAVFALFSRKSLLGSAYELNASELLGADFDKARAYPLSVLTQTWLFFKYYFLWLAPNPGWLSIDMREEFARSFNSWYLVSLLAFASWGAGAIYLLFKRGIVGLIGFAMLFQWILFFSEFSSVRIQEIFVLYRSYIWSIGLLCLVPILFFKLRFWFAVGLLSMYALILIPLSLNRLDTFTHPLLLWDDAEKLVTDHPRIIGAQRIYSNRGLELLKVDQVDPAISDFKKAIEISPKFFHAYGNLGAAYFSKKDYQSAIAVLTKSIQLSEEAAQPNARSYFARGRAFKIIGEFEKAQKDFQVSCQQGGLGCKEFPH